MRESVLFLGMVGFSAWFAGAQVKTTSVPLGDAVTKALQKSSLTEADGRPFHLRVTVSEPENPQSSYHGTFEEWWASSTQWRREVTASDGVKQVIVVSGGTKSEQDTGDYMPLWLRRFVWAALEPIPNATAWTASGLQIEQITMPNGAKSDACAKAKSTIGIGAQATDAFSNLCFDGSGRLKFYGSPRYSMEFSDYRGFGKKDVPRRFVDHPEPGTEIVGVVSVLEDLSKVKAPADLFTPLGSSDAAFDTYAVPSASLEQMRAGNGPILWPKVSSGNVRGRLAIYVSLDREGRVREAWPLNSDNAGLEDPARDQVRTWKYKPAVDKQGKPVQVDGGLGFAFETSIGVPLPELNDAEVRALAVSMAEPEWTPGQPPRGTVIEVQVSVNEAGKLTGTGFKEVPPAAQGPIMNAIQTWRFRPLLRDGKPQYFHGTVRFVIP